MSPKQRNRLNRLNELLQFAQLNLKEFTNGELETLRRGLVHAIYDRRNVTPADEAFMKLGSIYEAHRELRGAVLHLKKEGLTTLRLNSQDVTIAADRGGPFRFLYSPDDLQTAVYGSLAYLLQISEIVRDQLLECANSQCRKIFVPIRKPAKNTRAFCSITCARLVAVREYRQREAVKLKEKERNRSKKRYRRKILKT